MEVATLIIHTLSALLVAGGLFFAGRQLQLTHQTHKQNHDWNRRHAAQQATLDYPARTTGAEKLNKALEYSVAKEPIPLATIKEAFEKNEELRTICHGLLNYHESLAVGVVHRIYDEDVIKDIRKSTMTLLARSFANYIDYIGNTIQPTAWKHQQDLITIWKNKDLETTHRDRTA